MRTHIMDKRGEGVPIIISHSRKLSGKKPEYRLLDDAELLLTIFAAEPEKTDVSTGLPTIVKLSISSGRAPCVCQS
ncbi:hypothetical protein MASR1M12_24540 [Erysipelotrichia bacterium]